MKSFIVALFLPVTLLASQSQPTKEELLATVKHIEALAKETQAELDQEKQAHAQTQASLDAAQKANDETKLQFQAYQKTAETEIAKGNAAILSLSHVVKKLHTAKWLMSGLWIALCAFVALRLQSIPILGAYSLYGVAAATVAGVTFIWIWL